MQSALLEHLNRETASLVDRGLFKEERVITSAQSAEVMVDGPEGSREAHDRPPKRQQLSGSVEPLRALAAGLPPPGAT